MRRLYYAMIETGGKKDLCPFCRTPPPNSNEEQIKRVNKLMEKGNANAFYLLAVDIMHRELMVYHKIWQRQMNYFSRQGSLDVQWDITTWVLPMKKEWVWPLIRRKLSIIMS